MTKPLEFINVGNDLQGNPLLEINGEHHFYVDGERGESNGADHIWRAKNGVGWYRVQRMVNHAKGWPEPK